MKEKNLPPKTYLKCFNALPSCRFLDFYIDDKLISSHIGYEDFSKYVKVDAGYHTFSATYYKEKEVLYSKKVNLRPYSVFTLISSLPYKGKEVLNLFSIEEPLKTSNPEIFYIRAGCFAPYIPSSDLSLTEDYYLFKNLKYSLVTSYLSYKIGTYSLQLVSHKDASILFKIPNRLFKPQRFYTAYLIGLDTEEFPLKFIFSVDGTSFLKIEKPQVKTIS